MTVSQQDSHDNTFAQIPLAQISPNPRQPRGQLGDLSGLVASIRLHGVCTPAIVQPFNGEGHVLIAGHRRTEAAREAGLATIPAVIAEGDGAILALIENVHREDLNPLDVAAALQGLKDRGMSQKAIADQLGLDASKVSRLLRLLDLPDAVRRLIQAGALSIAAANELSTLAMLDRVATVTPHEVMDSLSTPPTWGGVWARNMTCSVHRLISLADVRHHIELAVLAVELARRCDDAGQDVTDYMADRLTEDEYDDGPLASDDIDTLHAMATSILDTVPDFSKLGAADRSKLEELGERYLPDHDLATA